MRGVVLAGGRSSRMRGYKGVSSKTVLPMGGLTILERNLSLAAAASDYVVLVKSPHMGPVPFPCEARVQETPNGPLDALRIGLEGYEGPAFVVLGDEVFSADAWEMVRTVRGVLRDVHPWAVLGWVLDPMHPERTRLSYSIEFSKSGTVSRVTEKPETVPNAFRGVGMYWLSSEAVGDVPKVPPRGNGQYEITDLFAWGLEHGKEIISFPAADREWNVNTPEIYEDALEALTGGGDGDEED